jgi:ElaB/YqjD/DUF883 family membrane-anchored ribosome-binding protein
MAEERDLATVRAPETTDTQEVSKEELQRRMEEARESITQTVAEIKDTVTNQYQAVKESVTEALDWREQYRKRPLAFSIGALSVGLIVGYTLAGAFVGDDDDDYRSYEQDETTGLRAAGAVAPAAHYYGREGAEGTQPSASHSYAAQAITGSSSSAFGSSGYDTGSLQESDASAAAPSPAPYQGTQQSAELEASAEEPQGPGLIERFKGTKAYDRLEEEVSALGDRFLNELSKTAQTVVLPLLFSKVKDLFGVDLSNKEGLGQASQRQGSSGSAATSSTDTNASLSGAAQSSFAGVNRGTATGREEASTQGGAGTAGTGNQATGGSGSAQSTGGSSYATSENRGYGASAGGGGDYNRGSD